MVFDITNIESFKAIGDKWLFEVNQYTAGVSCHIKNLEALIAVT